jgi:hypothetical protein
MMLIDDGRGHTVYGVQYFWVMFMGRLADGRPVTGSMSDGMSARYDGLDQATEDFVALGQSLHRLDVTRLEPQGLPYVGEKRVFTAPEDAWQRRAFPANACDLAFAPVVAKSDQSMVNDGLNLVFIAFSQRLVYGHFSGTCTLGGETVRLDNVYGHVEYVYSRW